MDILIKNMNIPKNCETCIFLFLGSRGRCFFSGCRCVKSRRPNGCPLVEVKPHGDLIDRDVTMAEFADRMCVDDILDGVYEPAVEVLRNAPTILEASDGTDNQG